MLLLHCLFGVSLSYNILADGVEEVNLINKLNDFYRFDHNLILVESPESASGDEISNCIPSSSVVPQTLYVINDISGEIKINGIGTSKNTFMIISLTSTNLERSLNFLNKVKDYQRMNTNVKIGLFFRRTLPTSDMPMQLFQWCWKKSIVSIFIGYQSEVLQQSRSEYTLLVYTFNPFGIFELIDLTGSESMGNYFPPICYNLRQHSIRIAAHNDINSLIYSEGNPNFGGPDGKLWRTIFRVINASYTMVEFLKINDGHRVPDMALNGTIDLGPQPCTVTLGKLIYLYPIYMDTVVIVVPSALPYSELTTYLQTFTGENTFIVTLVTIPVLIAALTVFRYMKRQRFLFFQSAADVLNLIMYDNLAIDYRNMFRVECFIILPLTLAGFVNINVLLSIITSYLTRPMDQPEINTFTDIERSPFSVIVPTKKNMDQLLVIFKESWDIDWRHKMAYGSLESFFHQILSFNTSICFVYFGSKVKNLIEHQKRLNIRGFRIPTQKVSQTAFAYVAPVDCPLKNCFNELIQWIMNAGLYWKWTDESYYEFVEKGFFSETQVNNEERGTEKYYVPSFIVYGWIGSGLIFLVEIVWNKLTIRYKNNALPKHYLE